VLKPIYITVLLHLCWGLGSGVAAPFWVMLQGKVLSLPRDDLHALERVHPGDPVYYQFLVDLERDGFMRSPGELITYRDTLLNGMYVESFFDSLVGGAHLNRRGMVVTEEMHGIRTGQDPRATTTLNYLSSDFDQLFGVQASFSDGPLQSPELWRGRSGTLLESLEDIESGKKSQLFTSILVVDVKPGFNPVSLVHRVSKPTKNDLPTLSISALKTGAFFIDGRSDLKRNAF
jgi:hypothetical protein